MLAATCSTPRRRSPWSALAAGSCVGDRLDAVAAELQRLVQVALGALEVVGCVQGLGPLDSCSDWPLKVLSWFWIWTSLALPGLASDAEEVLALLV